MDKLEVSRKHAEQGLIRDADTETFSDKL